MSQRGNQHAGWRQLDGILQSRVIHQRTTRSLRHQIILQNFIKTLAEATKAAALEAGQGEPRCGPAQLLAAWYQVLPGSQPWGAQPTTSVLPSPAPSSKLPLAGLMPSALKEKGSQPSPCFYRLWKQEAKQRLCLGPGCQGLVDPPQGSPQAFLAAPLCSGHPTCPGPCDFDDCHSWT